MHPASHEQLLLYSHKLFKIDNAAKYSNYKLQISLSIFESASNILYHLTMIYSQRTEYHGNNNDSNLVQQQVHNMLGSNHDVWCFGLLVKQLPSLKNRLSGYEVALKQVLMRRDLFDLIQDVSVYNY